MAQTIETKKKMNYGMIMAVYLFGIFMGALDTGIVTPARTIIQNNLHVGDQTGIWMITIYTLAYAASIPVMGKLADKYGRKIIYIVSILLFGLGSLFAGLSQNFDSFTMLLIARSIQAIGGGGIVPVATAEFGTIFPEEKRGLALGLVGGVYGIANIFGASAGSAILDLFGKDNWQYIFYVNIPITVFVVAAGLLSLPNTKLSNVKRVDLPGIVLLVLMVLSLIYGLRNIDFFDFSNSIQGTDVYPYLIAFVVILPFFIFAEKKAEDPVMNLSYFTSFRIITILLLSIASGIILMGVIFVPQFAENEMRIASGSGGYFVMILAVFAGVGSPFSGKLIDKYGAKLVLSIGFLLSIAGSLFLILEAIPHPSFLTVSVSLMLIGLGVGFTIGTPLNYMMLANTRQEESSSALATLSLVRSIGTTVAPAIMIGFLAHAGSNVQSNIMDILPQEISSPQLPYAQELTDKLTELKKDPNMKDQLAGLDFPDLTSMTTFKIDMNSENGDAKISDELLDQLKTADVTNITARTKLLATEMFRQNTPDVIADIQSGVQKGIDSLTSSKADLTKQLEDLKKAETGAGTGIEKMQEAVTGIGSGITGLEKAISQQKAALAQMNSIYDMLSKMPAGSAGAASTAGSAGWSGVKVTTGSAASVDATSGATTDSSSANTGSTGTNADSSGAPGAGGIPSSVLSKMPADVQKQLSTIKTPADLKKQIDALKGAIATLETKLSDMKSQKSQLEDSIAQATKDRGGLHDAVSGIQTALIDMDTTLMQMKTLKDAVPGAFDQALQDYLKEIDTRSGKIEDAFQSTLNGGFRQIYIATAVITAVAMLFLIFYPERKREDDLEPVVE